MKAKCENLHTEVEIARLLSQREESLSTAESCTGGLLGARLTAMAGSSSYYEGGVISYSNEVKAKVLQVPQEALDCYGAVSEVVAKAMAEGVKALLGTNYGISTTGIAGPGGGSADKPVGLVYSAIAGSRGTVAFRDIFEGNREEVRLQAVNLLFHRFVEYMEQC